jgi:hypothetical protein
MEQCNTLLSLLKQAQYSSVIAFKTVDKNIYNDVASFRLWSKLGTFFTVLNYKLEELTASIFSTALVFTYKSTRRYKSEELLTNIGKQVSFASATGVQRSEHDTLHLTVYVGHKRNHEL